MEGATNAYHLYDHEIHHVSKQFIISTVNQMVSHTPKPDAFKHSKKLHFLDGLLLLTPCSYFRVRATTLF
jgi:hypothetical protein